MKGTVSIVIDDAVLMVDNRLRFIIN